jgi:hypothetical protein
MKKIFLSKQVHSCFASLSSNDIFLYKEIKNIKDNKEKEIERYGDNQVLVIIIEPIKTFYDRGLYSHRPFDNRATPGEMKTTIQPYIKEGWKVKSPKEIGDYFKRERLKEYNKRKKEGYILIDYEKNRKPIEYKGGFSDLIYNHPKFQNYIKGGCFGYIGHYARKVKLDQYIEKQFLSIKMPKKTMFNLEYLLVQWLTSSDGRHFGDSLEYYSFEKQKEKIRNYLPQMYNNAFVYSLSEHQGSYKSTLDLKEKYKDYLLN